MDQSSVDDFHFHYTIIDFVFIFFKIIKISDRREERKECALEIKLIEVDLFRVDGSLAGMNGVPTLLGPNHKHI